MAWLRHSFGRVNAVITDSQGRVLLERRSDVPVWVLPGGKMERGETPKQAVVREVREETGLSVKVKRFVGVYRSKYFGYSIATPVFLCSITGGKLGVNAESSELKFFSLNRLPKDLLFLHAGQIRDALQGTRGDKLQKLTLWKVLAAFQFNIASLCRLFLFLVKELSRVG